MRIDLLQILNIIGGLGSLISEISTSSSPRRIVRIGINDQYTESGNWKELFSKYELDEIGIYNQIKSNLDE